MKQVNVKLYGLSNSKICEELLTEYNEHGEKNNFMNSKKKESDQSKDTTQVNSTKKLKLTYHFWS